MGKIIRPEMPINNDFLERPKKELKKAETTFSPIQLNTSKHRVNISMYQTKIIIISINADHCSMIKGY